VGNMINDASSTRKSKSRTAVAKTAFDKKKTVFTCKLDLIVRKKLQKCYNWSITLYGTENWALRNVDQKYLERF